MKSHKEILNSLKKQFDNFNIPIKDFENQILPAIVKTNWATEPQFHLELLKIERSRLPKGKIFEKETNDTYVQLGYDQKERIIFEKKSNQDAAGAYVKFISYQEDSIWSYMFSDQQIDGIEYQILHDNKPHLYASYKQGVVNTVDKYFYREDRLVKIDSFHSYEAFGDSIPQRPDYLIEYNKIGDISEIRRVDASSDFFPKGQDLVIYKKHKYSLKSLSDILVYETSELIKEELKKEDNQSKNCLILYLLSTFNSDDWLPPRIPFFQAKNSLTESTTIEEYININTDPDNLPYTVSEKLSEVSMLLMQEIELKEKYDLPLKLLLKVAKEIKDWCRKFPINSNTGKPLIILPLDFPDDYYEEVLLVLSRVYSPREIKVIQQSFDKNH